MIHRLLPSIYLYHTYEMKSKLTMISHALLTFREFAYLPFIKNAMKNPMSKESVLSFFYGQDYWSASHVDAMRQGVPLQTMNDLWYGGGDEYDDLCRNFIPVIRSLGEHQTQQKGSSQSTELSSSELAEWNRSVDGLMAQVICFDQLSRNCFRGSDEAFAYENQSLDIVRRIVNEKFQEVAVQGSTSTTALSTSTLDGEMYPPYVSSMITCLMHSESLSDMNVANSLVEISLERFQDIESVQKSFVYQSTFLDDHRKVIDKFGRYPHRNDKLGRETTPEEQAWLDDKENLPGWAKSQG